MEGSRKRVKIKDRKNNKYILEIVKLSVKDKAFVEVFKKFYFLNL